MRRALACVVVVACSERVQAPPPRLVPAVAVSVRTDLFDPRHAEWAGKHCVLVDSYLQAQPSIDGYRHPSNYALLLGPGLDYGFDVLGYLCPEMPPWPRQDQGLIQQYYSEARTGGLDRTRCKMPDANPRDYSISKPGSGAQTDDDVFVRVRFQRFVARTGSTLYPADRYKEPAVTQTRHVSCFPFAPLLLLLRAGGSGEFLQQNDVAGHRWTVELLDVGDEAMYMADLGVTGIAPAPKKASAYRPPPPAPASPPTRNGKTELQPPQPQTDED